MLALIEIASLFFNIIKLILASNLGFDLLFCL